MKSFGIKRDEKDPRWEKFIEWSNNIHDLCWNGLSNSFYGIDKDGDWDCIGMSSYFDRIITLDEWEAEFMQPKLAGREYDYSLLEDFKNYFCQLQTVDQYRDGTVKKYFNFEEGMMKDMVDGRYQKQDRISEIKSEIEKLSNELKELEKCLVN